MRVQEVTRQSRWFLKSLQNLRWRKSELWIFVQLVLFLGEGLLLLYGFFEGWRGVPRLDSCFVEDWKVNNQQQYKTMQWGTHHFIIYIFNISLKLHFIVFFYDSDFYILFKENQREGSQHQSADQNQGKSPAAKTQPTETGKKGQVCVLCTLKLTFRIGNRFDFNVQFCSCLPDF